MSISETVETSPHGHHGVSTCPTDGAKTAPLLPLPPPVHHPHTAGSRRMLHPEHRIRTTPYLIHKADQPPPFPSSHTPPHQHHSSQPLTGADPHPRAACARMLPASGPTNSCAMQPCQASQPCPSACGLAAWQYVPAARWFSLRQPTASCGEPCVLLAKANSAALLIYPRCGSNLIHGLWWLSGGMVRKLVDYLWWLQSGVVRKPVNCLWCLHLGPFGYLVHDLWRLQWGIFRKRHASHV